MPSRERYEREKTALARKGTTAYKQRTAPARLKRLGLTSTQAAGKPRRGERSARAVFARPDFKATIYTGVPGEPGKEPRRITFWTDRPNDVRAGRYMQLTRALREQRISPEEFRKRVRRMRPIDGFRPLDDPRAVLALIQTTAPSDIVFEYRGRSRPRRSRPRRGAQR